MHVKGMNDWDNLVLVFRPMCVGNSINFFANSASERPHRTAVDRREGVVIAGRRGSTATDRRPSLSATDRGRTCLIVSACSGSSPPTPGRSAWSNHLPYHIGSDPRGETQASVSGEVIMQRQLRQQHLANCSRLIGNFTGKHSSMKKKHRCHAISYRHRRHNTVVENLLRPAGNERRHITPVYELKN